MARRKGATRKVEATPDHSLPWRLIAVIMVVPLVLAGAVWGGVYVLDPTTFPVKRVRIESRLKEVGQDEVRQAVLPYVKGGFLQVDVDEIRGSIESLAWVSHASVRRSWPDVLVVQVEEQQALARWSAGGLLNPRGELFKPGEDKRWEHLPQLRGPKETEKVVMKQYRTMQGMLTSLGLRISHLSMNERRAWSLFLDNGLQLRLGRNDTELRLLRFVRAYANVLQPRLQTIDSVDLRYTNGFAVRWRENKSAAA